MREILFRGKRVDNGEWVYSQTVFRFLDSFYIPAQNLKCTATRSLNPVGNISAIRCNRGNYFFKVQTETIGQYTGLTDKNGKKIFEGDICRFDNGEPDESERYTNYAVQWDCVNCRYVVVDAYNCEDCLDIFFAKHAEVIGNIYDNPELLEVSE